MSEPFLAEIRIVGFNFAPKGWAFCDGQILPINQNQSLYSLLGTTYGGDGKTSFALPELRGRTPIHVGDGYRVGQKGGTETVTLTAAEIPAHKHALKASADDADSNSNAKALFATTSPEDSLYGDPSDASATTLSSTTITNAGGGQAHTNMQPYLTLNYCIALRGLFPSRN
jgi:microcystin-dependent protein